MSVKGENLNKLVKLTSNHFLTASNKLWVKNLWLRVKPKASLKPGSKMKLVWNTSDRSSHPEMFLGNGVLKICSKFTGEHPCRYRY